MTQDNQKPLKPVGKLNLRQEKFVGHYLKTGNASKAAIEAGYSEVRSRSQGSLLLKHPVIKEEISKKREKIAKKLELDAEFVLEGLKSIYQRCMQAEPVLDKDGIETGEYKFNPTSARRALRDIGEHIGMFVKSKDDSSEDENNQSRLVIVANTPKKSIDLSSKEIKDITP
nr:hypothetical protein 29 [bacterium]